MAITTSMSSAAGQKTDALGSIPRGSAALNSAALNSTTCMEITAGPGMRKVRGRILYILFFAAVASVLMWLLVQFSAPLALAAGLVAFMIGYMLFASALAAGRMLRHDQ